MPKATQTKYTSIFIGLLAACFFLPFLGGVHLFDWDEINFAEIAREMLRTGNYLQVQIDYQPFWEKPPLFMWLQAVSMKLWGVGEYGARFPNAICGIISLLFLYQVGKRWVDGTFGLFWAFCMLSAVLPHLYYKSGIIDPWFNLFIFSSFYFLISFSREGKHWQWMIAGILAGAALLTKGPVAVLILGLCFAVFFILKRGTWYVKPQYFLWYTLFSLLLPGLWIFLEWQQNGWWFLEEFTRYQWRLLSTPDAGHKWFPGFHVIVLLLGCFPASIFALSSIFKPQISHLKSLEIHRWMAILFWVVLVLFSVVQSKIVHYSSLCYFPITFFAAQTLYAIHKNGYSIKRGIRIGLWGVGLIYCVAILAFVFFAFRVELLQPLFQADPFALANLDAEVSWNWWAGLPAVVLLVLLLFSNKLLAPHAPVKYILGCLMGFALFVGLTLVSFVKRVEGYSQRAAIEFYQDKVGERAHIKPVGFKSYAHLFYADKMPGQPEDKSVKEWINSNYTGSIYFVCRINQLNRLKKYPELKELYRSNGFVFFERKK